METRRQARDSLMYEKGALYEVNIDFDGASEAWKKIKKALVMVVTNMFVVIYL